MFSLGSLSLFRANNRIKVNMFTLMSIVCLQTLCGCVVSTIDLYIIGINSSQINGTSLLAIGDDKNNETCPATDNDTASHGWPSEDIDPVVFRKNIANSFPAIFMSYILGLLMPFLGKRFVLLLPMVGISLQMVICLLIIYFHLGAYWWYFSGFVLGALGNTGTINLIVNLIIVDLTTKKNRSIWFVRFFSLQMGFEGSIMFLIFYFLQWRNFLDLFWFGLILQLITIGIVFLFLDLTSCNHSNTNSRISPTLSFDIFAIFHRNHHSKRQKISVALILISFAFYSLALSSIDTFFLAIANFPICWPSKLINIYGLVVTNSVAILTVIGFHLLARLTNTNEPLICAIGHIFFFISSIWTAFARNAWQVFVNSAFYGFSAYQNPLTLSMLSKWLNLDEINIAFIFIIEINQLITSYGKVFFKWVYTTVKADTEKSLTLFLAGGLSVIPFILNIYLCKVRRRTSEVILPISDEDSPLLDDIIDDDEPQPDVQNPPVEPAPTHISLMTIGNLTLSLTVKPRCQPKIEASSNTQTTQGATTEEPNTNLINL